MNSNLDNLLQDIKNCRVCEAHLPLGPRPVIKASTTARLMIIGQAPGTKVHESGIPWNDASGERLREWLDLDRETFYDERRVAIVPMGFCYPGTFPQGGDKPPRPECAPLWHPPLQSALNAVELTLLIGMYAQAYYLGRRRKRTLTKTVQAWRDWLPDYLTTPHPSWRTTRWLKNNPWFEEEVLPELRRRTHKLVEPTRIA